jgi:hypothetical protein
VNNVFLIIILSKTIVFLPLHTNMFNKNGWSAVGFPFGVMDEAWFGLQCPRYSHSVYLTYQKNAWTRSLCGDGFFSLSFHLSSEL